MNPTVYWRRRFFILCGALAVIAGLALKFTSAHPGLPAGARSSMAALQSPDRLPSGAYGSPWASSSPTQKATPSATATAAHSPRPHQEPSPSGAGTPHPSSSPVTDAKQGRCAPADIVLSLFTTQHSYHQGAQPQFDVYAVSTAASSCRMAFGPGSVRVIVTRHGRVVWDSQSCEPAAAPVTLFQLGVPRVLTLSWDRAATRPAGCAGTLAASASGTFEAVAMSAGQTSTVETFTLLP